MFGRRKRPVYRDDSKNLNRTVREFNSHDGPARIFYNRGTGCFFLRTYGYGSEDQFGPMLDTFDVAELYRKTDGSVQVSVEELQLLERDLAPYRMW